MLPADHYHTQCQKKQQYIVANIITMLKLSNGFISRSSNPSISEKYYSLYNFSFIWILAKFILEKCIFDFNIHTFLFMIYKCAITGTLELNAIENVVIVYKPITAITSTEVA